MVSRSRERHFPHTHRRGKKCSLHARHRDTTTFGMAAGSSGIVKYPSFMGTRGRGASLIGGETLHGTVVKSSRYAGDARAATTCCVVRSSVFERRRVRFRNTFDAMRG